MTSHWKDYGLERYRRVEDKMGEIIKFDIKYYLNVRKYLNSFEGLHATSSYGDDGTIYHTNWRNNGVKSKALILKPESVSIVNDHPIFDQIKKDLEEIIKKG